MNKKRTVIAKAGAVVRLLILSVCGLWASTQAAYAAITCSVTSPGWASSYFTTTATTTTGSAYATVTCTRATTDPTTQAFTVVANQGLSPGGTWNRAVSGANRLRYKLYTNATLATQWVAPNTIAGTINFGAATSASATVPYYYGIRALQAVAAGAYTDTVTMTLTYGAATATGTLPVTVVVSPVCTITTAPAGISFTYKSFQAAAATASTTFGVTCTNLVPYTVGLDAYAVTDSAINLAYTLNVGQTIRPTGAVYTPGAPLSASGSGAAQTISIDGSIAAGLAGTCAVATCTNAAATNKTRTLTVTY